MIEGVRVLDLKKNLDERGFFAELVGEDWQEYLGGDRIKQLSLSYSYPGIVRAWHRHERGQNDYMVALQGAVKVCVYDDREGSPSKGELEEFVLNGRERLQIARIVGSCWHGFKVVSHQPALIIYGVSKPYDRSKPDEQRRQWNDPTVIDPRTKASYDWNKPPHK